MRFPLRSPGWRVRAHAAFGTRWTVAALALFLIVGCTADAPLASSTAAVTVPVLVASTAAATPIATAAPPVETPTPTPTASPMPTEAPPTPRPVAPPPPPPPVVQAVRPVFTPVPRTPGARFLVALDPGHGGDEVGAAAYGVVERESNLDMAERVERALRVGGVDVLLTRSDGNRAPGAVMGAGFSATRADLQARVQAANAAGAAVFVSLHSNGSGDTEQRGVEVYYESRREFADENKRLASLVLDGALRGLSLMGYPSRDRGILDSACWRSNNGRCVGLFVLSPSTGSTQGLGGAIKEATHMPAVLAELLFISNPDDAALLRDSAVRDGMAQGVADGILRYLGAI